MKQLITIVLDLKRWRVDPEALQVIQLDISMIFYVGKLSSASCYSLNDRDTWSSLRGRRPKGRERGKTETRHENQRKRLLKILSGVLLNESQQQRFYPSSSVFESLRFKETRRFVSFAADKIVQRLVVSATPYRLSL